MTKSFLIEIGTEEIPARFVTKLLKEFRHGFLRSCEQHRLSVSEKSLQTFATGRRLTLYCDAFPSSQEALDEVLTGPPLTVAQNEAKDWTPAALGFAKKVGVQAADLEIIEDSKGRACVGIRKQDAGSDSLCVLSQILPAVIEGISLPIAMRWGHLNKDFFRPVHWILCLLDAEVVPFECFEIQSSNVTYAHRFLTQSLDPTQIASGEQITISSPEHYDASLSKKFVLADPDKRRALIQKGLSELDLDVESEDPLLNEVIYLSEWPEVLTGAFDSMYLSLPEEVLVTCMTKHQKYFALRTQNVLNARFALVGDNVSASNRETVIKGNERVLKARLEDVRFFWEEDQKVGFELWNQRLSTVVFQKGLGSVSDKVGRIVTLSKTLIEALSLETHADDILEAASLCKADLVSQMVIEHPSLQGIMGAYYAEKQGYSPAVCRGIRDHYDLDPSKESVVASVIGIADRLDTIVACYANGLIPTGSKDPWGIRRSMLTILRIVLTQGWDLRLQESLDAAYDVLGSETTQKDQLIVFFRERMKQFFLEKGIAYDVVDSLINNAIHSPLKAFNKAVEIETYRREHPKQFKEMVETAVRVSRLLANETHFVSVDTGKFVDPEESTAYTAYKALNGHRTITDLHSLTQPLTDYFDKVLVMAKEEGLKQNRVAFLNELRQVYLELADFEAFVI